MEQAAGIARARALFGASPRPLAFVPTMGALHPGHLELVRQVRSRAATVGASIFVNPLQFGAKEDLARYPRDLERDAAKLAAEGVDVLFAPDAAEMYAPGFSTSVDPGPLATIFEGAVRPGHFCGVATVIVKLLNVVRPDTLVLGQKDAQQAVILRKVLRELDAGVNLEIVPTVRESDGLAMSSRNAFLDPAQRAAAPSLHRALGAILDLLERGADKRDALAAGAAQLDAAAQLDYLDVVDADDFEPLERLRRPAFVIGAARFGTTRLIDNLWVR